MPNTRTPRAIACALAALAAIAGGSALSAQTIDVTGTQRTGTPTKSVQVAYGDLDLAAPAGVERLDRRLRWAAGYVCGGSSIRGLYERNDHAACTAATLDDATSRMRAIAPSMVAGG